MSKRASATSYADRVQPIFSRDIATRVHAAGFLDFLSRSLQFSWVSSQHVPNLVLLTALPGSKIWNPGELSPGYFQQTLGLWLASPPLGSLLSVFGVAVGAGPTTFYRTGRDSCRCWEDASAARVVRVRRGPFPSAAGGIGSV
jgi:hypothetical protein